MATPDLTLVDYLNANVAALTKGTNLFAGKLRREDHVPQVSVAVLSTGGPAPIAYAGGTTTERRFASVQIMVRSPRDSFEAGQTLARTVHAAAHRASLTGYLDVRANSTSPLYLGESPAKLHEWSINLELWYEE